MKNENLEKIDIYARTARRRRENEIEEIETVVAEMATLFISQVTLKDDSVSVFIKIPPRIC